MGQESREVILGKLKAAPTKNADPRPTAPPLKELSWDTETMIRKFTENLVEQTGVVYRVADNAEAVGTLAEITVSEGITKVIASTDVVVSALNLPKWGRAHGVEVLLPGDFEARDSFKQAAFVEAQASITGVDYAIAETGTLVLIHDKHQPRLVSLAPITHIAVVPVGRLRPVYEGATDGIYGEATRFPSHVTFITGPSMTADIQGVPFKGMHGPKKLFVVLIG